MSLKSFGARIFLVSLCSACSSADATHGDGSSSGNIAPSQESPPRDPSTAVIGFVEALANKGGGFQFTGQFFDASTAPAAVTVSGAGHRIQLTAGGYVGYTPDELGDVITFHSDEPSFEGNVRVPQPITVTAPSWLADPSAPVVWPVAGPIEIAWTYAGDDDDVVIFLDDASSKVDALRYTVAAKEGHFSIDGNALDAFRQAETVDLGVTTSRMRQASSGTSVVSLSVIGLGAAREVDAARK